MKARYFLAIPFFILAFGFYTCSNSLNPGSRFCLYEIYKTPKLEYQVWWNCRTRHLESTFGTYEEAKDYQIKQCDELKQFMGQSPDGKRVR